MAFSATYKTVYNGRPFNVLNDVIERYISRDPPAGGMTVAHCDAAKHANNKRDIPSATLRNEGGGNQGYSPTLRKFLHSFPVHSHHCCAATMLVAKLQKQVSGYSTPENSHENDSKQKRSTASSLKRNLSQKVSYTHSSSILPALLVFLCPAFVMLFSFTAVKLEGSPLALLHEIQKKGFWSVLYSAWVPYMFGSTAAWKFIIPYAAFELVLMRILPGKLAKGPTTPAGHVPVYKANGMLAYLVTLGIFFICTWLEVFNPADIYDHFLEFIGAMNLFSLILCLGLYLKGRIYPSSNDYGVSGDFLFDYYWGTELYPRICGWDIKMFTNCRFGMMGWALLVLSYTIKQYQAEGGLCDSMVVSTALQLIYITKFFHWEMGYMRSLDIMHDRAGWYLCWGCLVWVPSLYTSPSLYLTSHPNSLGLPLAAAVFAIGTTAIFLNYDADSQREKARSTNGDCDIWGKKAETIRATFITSEGEEKESLLLVSGWWGVSRHFHYVPELLAALCWSIPALFQSILPYCYFFFLLILLSHRAVRDDRRCAEKYGHFWDLYCDRVPYKILPIVF